MTERDARVDRIARQVIGVVLQPDSKGDELLRLLGEDKDLAQDIIDRVKEIRRREGC